jgi:hypothetical protein
MQTCKLDWIKRVATNEFIRECLKRSSGRVCKCHALGGSSTHAGKEVAEKETYQLTDWHVVVLQCSDEIFRPGSNKKRFVGWPSKHFRHTLVPV